jgi:hypothetical protein
MLALRWWTAGAPLAVVTEGGYDLQALEQCLDATVAVLSAPLTGGFAIEANGPTPRGDKAVAAVRTAQSRYWAGL